MKKREQDNLDFSKKVIQSWEYNRSGALAKKVCYEGMLPHTRIMVGLLFIEFSGEIFSHYCVIWLSLLLLRMQ